jgi:hypothetical protein
MTPRISVITTGKITLGPLYFNNPCPSIGKPASRIRSGNRLFKAHDKQPVQITALAFTHFYLPHEISIGLILPN